MLVGVTDRFYSRLEYFSNPDLNTKTYYDYDNKAVTWQAKSLCNVAINIYIIESNPRNETNHITLSLQNQNHKTPQTQNTSKHTKLTTARSDNVNLAVVQNLKKKVQTDRKLVFCLGVRRH